MSSLPTPRAQRLTVPGWRDPRLLVGALLVALSIGGTTRVVAAADHHIEVYAANRTLVAGESVQPENLSIVRIDVEGGSAGYLPVSQGLRPGSVLTRTVHSGELLPVSAVGDPEDLERRAVTVPVDAAAAEVLVAGSSVDLWVSPKNEESGGARYREPELVLEGVEVARVQAARRGMVTSLDGVRVQVLVPREAVATVIAAVDQEAKVTLVPATGALPVE